MVEGKKIEIENIFNSLEKYYLFQNGDQRQASNRKWKNWDYLSSCSVREILEPMKLQSFGKQYRWIKAFSKMNIKHYHENKKNYIKMFQLSMTAQQNQINYDSNQNDDDDDDDDVENDKDNESTPDLCLPQFTAPTKIPIIENGYFPHDDQSTAAEIVSELILLPDNSIDQDVLPHSLIPRNANLQTNKRIQNINENVMDNSTMTLRRGMSLDVAQQTVNEQLQEQQQQPLQMALRQQQQQQSMDLMIIPHDSTNLIYDENLQKRPSEQITLDEEHSSLLIDPVMPFHENNLPLEVSSTQHAVPQTMLTIGEHPNEHLNEDENNFILALRELNIQNGISTRNHQQQFQQQQQPTPSNNIQSENRRKKILFYNPLALRAMFKKNVSAINKRLNPDNAIDWISYFNKPSFIPFEYQYRIPKKHNTNLINDLSLIGLSQSNETRIHLNDEAIDMVSAVPTGIQEQMQPIAKLTTTTTQVDIERINPTEDHIINMDPNPLDDLAIQINDLTKQPIQITPARREHELQQLQRENILHSLKQIDDQTIPINAMDVSDKPQQQQQIPEQPNLISFNEDIPHLLSDIQEHVRTLPVTESIESNNLSIPKRITTSTIPEQENTIIGFEQMLASVNKREIWLKQRNMSVFGNSIESYINYPVLNENHTDRGERIKMFAGSLEQFDIGIIRDIHGCDDDNQL